MYTRAVGRLRRNSIEQEESSELKGRRNKGVIAARATCKVEGAGGQAEDDGSNARGGDGE